MRSSRRVVFLFYADVATARTPRLRVGADQEFRNLPHDDEGAEDLPVAGNKGVVGLRPRAGAGKLTQQRGEAKNKIKKSRQMSLLALQRVAKTSEKHDDSDEDENATSSLAWCCSSEVVDSSSTKNTNTTKKHETRNETKKHHHHKKHHTDAQVDKNRTKNETDNNTSSTGQENSPENEENSTKKGENSPENEDDAEETEKDDDDEDDIASLMSCSGDSDNFFARGHKGCFKHDLGDLDPAGGCTNYDLKSADKDKLTSVVKEEDSGKTKVLRLSVDDTAQTNTDKRFALAPEHLRKSVRVTTKEAMPLDSITVIDVLKMPTGDGVWGLLMSQALGKAWPDGMQIILMENMNEEDKMSASLHSKNGCTMPWDGGDDLAAGGFSPWTPLKTSGQKDGTVWSANTNNCNYSGRSDVTTSPNVGCQVATEGVPMGKDFNDADGGAFVLFFNDDVIAMWFIAREDLKDNFDGKIRKKEHLKELLQRNNNKKSGDKKHKPFVVWPLKKDGNCEGFVKPQYFTININLCGEGAGEQFARHGGEGLLSGDKAAGDTDGEYFVGEHKDETEQRNANKKACEKYVAGDDWKDANKDWRKENGDEDLMPRFDIRSFDVWNVKSLKVTAKKLQGKGWHPKIK